MIVYCIRIESVITVPEPQSPCNQFTQDSVVFFEYFTNSFLVNSTPFSHNTRPTTFSYAKYPLWTVNNLYHYEVVSSAYNFDPIGANETKKIPCCTVIDELYI